MTPSTIALALALAAALSACGGAGGGSMASAPIAPPPAASTADLAPTVGDFYSYDSTNTLNVEQAGSTPETQQWFYTRAVNKVDGGGAWVDRQFGEDAAVPSTDYAYLADGGLTTMASGGCRGVYTPAFYASRKNMMVGTTWTSDFNRVDTGPCAASVSGKFSATAAALETITVRAGTFNTVKIVSTSTGTYSNGLTTAEEITEWRDVVTHRIIKYSNRSNQVSDTGAKATLTFSGELAGFSSAKQARKNLNIERFAGQWAGAYSGTDSGNCQGRVSRDGKLDVDCGNGEFSVHGDIDASGQGTFYLTVKGVRGAPFSSSFESPFAIRGVWSAGAASGTWTLNHQ